MGSPRATYDSTATEAVVQAMVRVVQRGGKRGMRR
jgi:hypothetical protein